MRREARRGGGGGDGAGANPHGHRSSVFGGDLADAFEREVARDRSPGRARRAGGSPSPASPTGVRSGASGAIDVPAAVSSRDRSASATPRATADPVIRDVDREEVRVQRRDRAPAPTEALPASMDPRDRARRGWRAPAGPGPAEAAERAWHEAVPGIALLERPRRKGTPAPTVSRSRADATTDAPDRTPVGDAEAPEAPEAARRLGDAEPARDDGAETAAGRAPAADARVADRVDAGRAESTASAGGARARHRGSDGIGSPSRRGAAALAADPAAARFPLHAAAFYGDLDALRGAVRAALRSDRGARAEDGGAEGSGSDHSPHPALVALDACGNTAAHVAVLRGDARALALLLDDDVCDFPVDARSAGGWTLTQEATHARNRKLVRFLVEKASARARRDARRETRRLVAALHDVPDMTMQMRWAFGSAVFGPVLRAYAPSDTYDIAKRGGCVRVDGALRGADEERNELGEPKSLLPKWKRGAFSLLFRGAPESRKGDEAGAGESAAEADAAESAVWYLDHETREAVDVSEASGDGGDGARLGGFSRAELIDAEVDALLARGSIAKEKYEAGDVTFEPVKSWLGGDRVESVGPWRASVWEARGFVAKRRVTRAGAFAVGGTFGEYLASSREGAADLVERNAPSAASAPREARSVGEEGRAEGSDAEKASSGAARAPEDAPALSPSGGNVGGGAAAANGATPRGSRSCANDGTPESRPLTSREARRRRRAARSRTEEVPKPRRVTARCWIAEGFPVRVEDVAPILDIASRANKHLKKAKRAVEYWRGAHAGKFPVKITVPIMMTVYATIDFRNFRAAEADPARARGSGAARARRHRDGSAASARRTGAPADGANTPADPAFFEVPPGYARKSLAQALREAEERERRQLEAEARARRAARDEAQRRKQLEK